VIVLFIELILKVAQSHHWRLLHYPRWIHCSCWYYNTVLHSLWWKARYRAYKNHYHKAALIAELPETAGILLKERALNYYKNFVAKKPETKIWFPLF
jgi:hypothetical protein